MPLKARTHTSEGCPFWLRGEGHSPINFGEGVAGALPCDAPSPSPVSLSPLLLPPRAPPRESHGPLTRVPPNPHLQFHLHPAPCGRSPSSLPHCFVRTPSPLPKNTAARLTLPLRAPAAGFSPSSKARVTLNSPGRSPHPVPEIHSFSVCVAHRLYTHSLR